MCMSMSSRLAHLSWANWMRKHSKYIFFTRNLVVVFGPCIPLNSIHFVVVFILFRSLVFPGPIRTCALRLWIDVAVEAVHSNTMKINEKNLCMFATSPPVDREGWLLKRGEVNKSWQRRYFVLKGNLLFYFEKKGDREPLGVIILEGCTIGKWHENVFHRPGNRLSNHDEFWLWH